MPAERSLIEQIEIDDALIDAVTVPESVIELGEMLAEASAAGRRVLMLGGGTRLRFGNVGGPFDLAISTRRLNNVLHYEPNDMTLAVEAGCTIADIEGLLRGHGQFMALDAARASVSTIGGAYATGLSGPRRLSGGSLKDWTIGVESVGPDGTLARAGGMVVKNVTGYDMMHVHYAALGAFGVVTRLNLKVFPLAGPPKSVIAHFRAPDNAFAAAHEILRSQLQPSSVLVSSADDGAWSLRVRCDGPLGVVDGVTRRIEAVIGTHGELVSCDVGDEPGQALDPFLTAIDLVDNAGVARLPVPASKQPAIVATVAAFESSAICADVGSGLVYVTGPGTSDWVESIRGVVARPTFMALPSAAKHGIDVFGETDPPNAAIVRRLKATYDPGGVLNAGRFVLGL